LGALTLKSFSFVLRSWEIKSYESIDPTDAFGQNTSVYLNKNKIIKIEPRFSNKMSNIWLTDKGRHFFDSIFGSECFGVNNISLRSAQHWKTLFNSISKIFYISNICNLKYASRHFFIVIFENVNLEVLNFLSLISQVHPLLKIKRAEKFKVKLNVESSFQINSAASDIRLSASSLCLLIGTNPRYEGSYLNLKLRQRYLKGNFKLLTIGPFLDLTFPTSFTGSSIFVLKSISEGNNVLCRDIIYAENPIFVTSSVILKHSNIREFLNVFNVLKYSNLLNEVWNGSNILNSSLHETGLHTFSHFSFLTFRDLILFSSFYLLNVNLNNILNLKTLAESRLLHYKCDKFLNKNLLIHQNFTIQKSNFFKFIRFKKYLYLPSSTFFENQETFITTEGFRKIGSKLIFRKNTKSDWQLLRKLAQIFLGFENLIYVKVNKILLYENKSLFDCKNFIYFHFYAVQNLTNLNEHLLSESRKFILYKKFNIFKNLTVKMFYTKLKYWLDDFYIGGKDFFCQNSLTLTRCSANWRSQTTNFF